MGNQLVILSEQGQIACANSIVACIAQEVFGLVCPHHSDSENFTHRHFAFANAFENASTLLQMQTY